MLVLNIQLYSWINVDLPSYLKDTKWKIDQKRTLATIGAERIEVRLVLGVVLQLSMTCYLRQRKNHWLWTLKIALRERTKCFWSSK